LNKTVKAAFYLTRTPFLRISSRKETSLLLNIYGFCAIFFRFFGQLFSNMLTKLRFVCPEERFVAELFFWKKMDSLILDFERKVLGFLAGTFPIFFQNSTQRVRREILRKLFSGKKCKSISFSERKDFSRIFKPFSTHPGENFEEKFN